MNKSEIKSILKNVIFDINLCLSDVPKDKIFKANNGKCYINIVVAQRTEPDQWKRDIKVYMSQDREERKNSAAKIYVGAGKSVIFVEVDKNKVNEEDLPF